MLPDIENDGNRTVAAAVTRLVEKATDPRPVIEMLLRGLQGDRPTRLGALTACAWVGPPAAEALPAIRAIAADASDPDLMNQAKYALGNVTSRIREAALISRLPARPVEACLPMASAASREVDIPLPISSSKADKLLAGMTSFLSLTLQFMLVQERPKLLVKSERSKALICLAICAHYQRKRSRFSSHSVGHLT